MRATPWIPLLTLLLAAPVTADSLGFEDGGWELIGPDTKVTTVDGTPTLQIGSGRAIRRNVKLKDGTIELDMQVTGKRSFVYIQFRMASDRDHEEIYFRSHKSEQPDALQYTPVFHGISNWQLYHGPGGTASVALPPGQWIHVRLELEGSKGAVFVGDATEPQLVISELAREPEAGDIALRGFVPRGSGAPHSVRYANVVVKPGKTTYDFASLQTPAPPEGLIRRWDVSETFVPEDEDPAIARLPDGVSYRTLTAERSGLLLLSRYKERPAQAQRWSCLARVRLNAAEAGIRRIDLGYSDEVSVFLNGRLLFAADDSYLFDGPRRQGLIGLAQASLYLPLHKGENELVLAVTDGFGGWGLMARLPDRSGLELSP